MLIVLAVFELDVHIKATTQTAVGASSANARLDEDATELLLTKLTDDLFAQKGIYIHASVETIVGQ